MHVQKTWVTIEGQRIPFSQVTHQHWSNIYWYHTVFKDLPGMSPHIMERAALEAEIQIYQNFQNEILPWKPIFEFELNWLNHLSLVRKKDEKMVVVDKLGREIGEIIGLLKFVPGVTLFELN